MLLQTEIAGLNALPLGYYNFQGIGNYSVGNTTIIIQRTTTIDTSTTTGPIIVEPVIVYLPATPTFGFAFSTVASAGQMTIDFVHKTFTYFANVSSIYGYSGDGGKTIIPAAGSHPSYIALYGEGTWAHVAPTGATSYFWSELYAGRDRYR